MDSDNQNLPDKKDLAPKEFTQTEEQFFNLFENWSALSTTERREKFKELPRTEAEELFLSLKTHDQVELLEEATPLEKRSWVRMLAPDEVADLFKGLALENRNGI